MVSDNFNIEDLRLVDTPTAPPKLRRGLFVRVPLEWVHRLAGARYAATTTLALHLLHRTFQEHRQTIRVANGLLALKGISRGQKWRALAELQAMGLVEIEHRERKSPIITLLYPEEGNT